MDPTTLASPRSERSQADTSLRTSLLDLLRTLFHRKWTIVVIILATLVSALVYRFIIRGPVYQLEAKVLVKIGREQAPPVTLMGDKPMIIGYREQDVNSEIALLASYDVIAEVVDKLHLDVPTEETPPDGWFPWLRFQARQISSKIKDWQKDLSIRLGLADRLTPREEAIALLAQGLSIETMTDSNVILVTQTVPMREGSSLLLNTLLEAYLRKRVEVFRDPAAVEFLSDQREQSKHRLDEAMRALADYERTRGIIELDPQLDTLIRQISIEEAKLVDSEVRAADAQLKLERFKQQTTSPKPDFATTGGFVERSYLESLLKMLTDVELERIKLELTESADGRLTQNNREQSSVLIELAESNLTAVAQEATREMELRRKNLDELRRRQADLQASRAGWQDLKRQVDLSEESFALYTTKLEEATATASLDRAEAGNVSVVQWAHDPIVPSGPRLRLFMGLALALGLLASIAWVSVMEFFDHSVRTPEALERQLSAPVWSVIPFDSRARRQALL